MIRRRRETALRPELVDWLLLGGPLANDDAERSVDRYDSFLEFDAPAPDLRALWVQHRRALLDEWRRRGQAGLPWAAREFDKREDR